MSYMSFPDDDIDSFYDNIYINTKEDNNEDKEIKKPSMS